MVTRTSWFLTAVVVASCLVGRHAEAQPAGERKPPQPGAAAAAEGDADDPHADAANDAEGDAANEADEGSEQRAPDATAPEPAEVAKQPALDGPAGLQVHHAPLSVAEPHSELSIPADIEHPQLVRRAVLVYRLAGETELRETEFQRSPTGKYAAVIPAEQLKWPGFAYAIEVEQTDGSRVAAFASRESLHEVQVPEDLEDVRERVLDQRVDGRRSVFASSAEYVSFGRSQAETVDASGAVITESVPDWYYRLEGSYTYRPLRIVSEFSLRIGVVRGRSPVPLDSDEPDQDIDDRRKVGLNYGAPTVRFRLHDIVQLEGEGFLSITEVGFSAGGGAAVLVGDPYGSKLTVGFESIEVFGTRIYTRMDVQGTERVMISPMIEVTDMPHANEFGVRLLGQIGVDIGQGFSAAVRGGYQARVSTGGGPAAGGSLAYAF